jgi:hypothetical protein
VTVDVLSETSSAPRRQRKDARSRSAPLSALLAPLLLSLAAAIWFIRPTAGPWPLLLVALGALISASLLHQPWIWTPFDLPLLLFLASAGLGAGIAHTQGLAWPKFWEVVSSLVLFRALLLLPARVRLSRQLRFSPWRWLFGLLPALIALVFALTYDWQTWGGKMAWLDAVAQALSPYQVSLPGFMWVRSASGAWSFHPNVAGGMLAALLPLQVAAAATSRRWPARGVLALATLLALAGLILTGSRGAWLALGVAGGAWAAWALSQRWPAQMQPAARRRIWLALLAAAAVAGFLLVVGLCGPGCRASAAGRLVLFQDALGLALDTPFTGLGLGGERFQMAYSSYVLLLPVGYLPHSHNLPVQVLLEQGILGLLALLWITAAVVLQRGPYSLWQAAARASFAVIVIHGLVDIPLYTGRGLHLLFIPLAAMASPALRPAPQPAGAQDSGSSGRSLASSLLLPAALLVGLALLLLPPARAAVQANLGALAQTRAELALYYWPDWPLQDELRRTGAVDLAPIVARYQAALAQSPANAAANRRLGQIELSLGQYEAARQHLEAAYASAPGHRATRQLLAESYAIAGDLEQAAALLRTVDMSLNQIEARIWWYNHVGEPQHADLIRQAEALASGGKR